MKLKETMMRTGLSADTIRYYEKIGVILSVPRLENGLRDFTEDNLTQLLFVKQMRQAGVSIATLKVYTELLRNGVERTMKERCVLLIKEAKRLDEELAQLQQSRNFLQEKIDNYDERIRKSESKYEEK